MPGAIESQGARRGRLAMLVLGALGAALAIGASPWLAPGALERALGVPAGSLAWGPALFFSLLAVHGLLLMVAGARGRSGSTTGATAPAGRPARQTRPLMALAAITAVALGLRLWHLESGLWHDEIGTLIEFVRPAPGTILTSFRNQNQHMLYSLAAHFSIAWLGESAAALRLPAAIFGVASVPALYPLARQVAGVRASLLACALMAVSYHHVWFSQNARGYTGVLLFTLLATWLWLEALERDDWRRWLSYVAMVALGMWVHLTMAFVVAAHGLVFLALLVAARRRPPAAGPLAAAARPGRALAAFALCVTVTLQLYALGLPAFLSSGLHEVSLDSEWISPLWLAVETVRGLAAGFSGPLVAAGLAVTAGGLALLVVGWWGVWRRCPALAVACVLPGLLVVGLMVALRHNLWPRFLFFAAGFALLVVVRGAFDLGGWLARRAGWPQSRARAMATALVAVAIVASLASLPAYYALPKQDYRGAMDFVDGRLGPGDVAVSVGLARVAYERLYAVDRPRWTGAEDAADLARLRRQHGEMWLVYSLPTHLRRWHPDVWRAVDEDFEAVRTFPGTLRGGEVHVLKARRTAGPGEGG